MTDRERIKLQALSDLQEIIFWQKLNSQFLAKQIDKSFSGSLKDFCLNNSLFPKINSSQLSVNIPLSLINFSNKFYVSFYSEKWLDTLNKTLTREFFYLSIEEALADTFEAVEHYNRKYNLIDVIAEEDDNETLYKTIDSYLEMKEKLGWDFPAIVTELYDIKSQAILDIEKNFPGEYRIDIRDDKISLHIDNADVINSINELYIQNFCDPAASKIKPLTSNLVETFLPLTKQLNSAKGHDEETDKFIECEVALVSEERASALNFQDLISNRKNQGNVVTISICNLSPFGFLVNPFPTV